MVKMWCNVNKWVNIYPAQLGFAYNTGKKYIISKHAFDVVSHHTLKLKMLYLDVQPKTMDRIICWL